MKPSMAMSFAPSAKKTPTRSNRCPASSSIRETPRFATGSAPPARSSISTCSGCNTRRAIARSREQEPACASPIGRERSRLKIGAHRIGDRAEAVAGKEGGQLVLDAAHQWRALIDQHRVELHQGRTGADLGVGIGARTDTAGAY